MVRCVAVLGDSLPLFESFSEPREGHCRQTLGAHCTAGRIMCSVWLRVTSVNSQMQRTKVTTAPQQASVNSCV